MTKRCKPAWAILALVAGLTGLVSSNPAKAQAWADTNYKYRRPLTLSSANTFAAGDIIAYNYSPTGATYAQKMRPDGQDLKIVYYNGSANVAVPQAVLTGANRVLFAAVNPIAPQPYLTENLSAGTTAWSTILAATPESTRVTMTHPAYAGGADDDADTNVTLPFSFPFKNGVSNQLGISTDGYLQPGGTTATYLRYLPNANGIDDPAKFALQYVIGAWMADLGTYRDAGFTDRGVFYYSDATQAIIRWKATDTGDTATVVMNFAVILKPDGSIRFVYGPQVDPAPGQTMKEGIGGGSVANSIVNTSTTSYGGHADILYTQYLGVTGYWAYYGNTFDDGKTGRVAPSDPTKLVAYTFDDGTLQGWTTVSANPDTKTLETASFQGAKVLHVVTGVNGNHPQVQAAGQTTFLGDSLVYARIAGGEMGIGARCADDKSGYYHLQPGYGNQKQIIERGTTDDYKIISNTKAFTVSGWTTSMLQVTGTDAAITIQGKGWNQYAVEPSAWEVTNTAALTTDKYNTGTLGLTGYSADMYLDWAYATDPKAETVSGSAGTEEQTTGAGVITGTVREKWYRTRQSGMRVVVTNSSGNYLGETATDANGVYTAIVPNGTYSVTAIGGGRSAGASVTVSGGATVTQDLLPDVVANGDCEVPTADGTWPDQWEYYLFSAGGLPAFAGLSNEQNHTPGGHWSLKIAGVVGANSGFQTGAGRGAQQLFDHPVVPGCSYTLSVWVYFTAAGDNFTFRLRNGWPIDAPVGDNTRMVITAGAAPNVTNENTGGLDANGKVPVGQWYQVKRTWKYVAGGSTNPTPVEYSLYTQPATAGGIYFDDVTLTATPVILNQVVAAVVDDAGNPIASPYLGEMRYGGKLFSVPALGDATGVVRMLTTTTTPITLAAWQGPTTPNATSMEQTGALVGITNAVPVPYDPNLSSPTATVVVTRHAINVLGAGNGTKGLLNGDSKWSSFLIDKRTIKTNTANPGDDTSPDNPDPSTWVQVRRDGLDPTATTGQDEVAKLWDFDISNQGNGLKTGGLRGILSSCPQNLTTCDIPLRYETSTLDIDLGSTQSIDQFEIGSLSGYGAKKQRIWISDTPFQWNVELPNSAAVVDTTTDATSVEGQGFVAANKAWDSAALGAYQIYRFLTPITGRYLRVLQDGSPYGDGHQVFLEMRAMSVQAYPKPVSGRVIDASGAPVAGAFVGPFTNGALNNYAKTAADGTFTWSGPGVPTALYAHVEAKRTDNTYDPTPYLAAGPVYVTPHEGGTNVGDMVVVRSGGNAMLGASSIVIDNSGGPGTESFGAGFCDPTETAHPLSKLTDGLAGDANQWAAKPSINAAGDPCIGDVTTGATDYLRVGIESTLTAPADIDEVDIYWFQNGYPAGFYVQTSSNGGTTWTTVYSTTSYAGNYSDDYPANGLRVSPIKFATKTGVNKIRVIFSTPSTRNNPENEFIINEIVALKHVSTPVTLADVAQALRVAAGLLPGPPSSDPTFAKLNIDGDLLISLRDAVKLDKTVTH